MDFKSEFKWWKSKAMNPNPDGLGDNPKDWPDLEGESSGRGYGATVMLYAEQWADAMEDVINTDSSRTLVSVFEDKSLHPDFGRYGITGFQYGAVISTLSVCWVYGEALRRWHNKEYGVAESDGVVNPAIWNFEVKEDA